MRLHRAVMAALALYALVILGAAAALLAAAGRPGRFPDLLLPLAATLLVAAASAVLIAGRAANGLGRPLRDLAAAAWSGVEGRLRPAREPSAGASFEEIREAIVAYNALVRDATHTIAALECRKFTLESVLAHMSDGLLVILTPAK